MESAEGASPPQALPLLDAVLGIPGGVAAFWPVLAVAGVGTLASLYFQPSRTGWAVRLRYAVGFTIAMDFIIMWLPFIVFQGAFYKHGTQPFLGPVFEMLDNFQPMRWLAKKFVYEKPKYSDYFMTQLLFLFNFLPNLVFIVYMQLTRGSLPWWALAIYYFNWVGIGSRCMGAAYFMAHKEGHSLNMYKPWIREIFGNVFENWVGMFYGSVWNNFTTTHIALHHRLDSGQGDTLYCWDCNRASIPDFLVYQCRGLLHMSGLGALYQFWRHPECCGHDRHFRALRRGVIIYWALLPTALFVVFRSVSFYFWVVIHPLFCMGFFLALLNLGFHAFIENSPEGYRVQCIESIALLGGQDDFFGENDHMAHHYHTNVYWRDLTELQEKQIKEWETKKASVFKDIDVFTFSIFVIMKAWPFLADRFVYSGDMTKAETMRLIEARATRREAEHRHLLPGLPTPSRPRGYGPEPSPPPVEGSESYHRLLKRLGALQLAIAAVMEQALPPVQKKWPQERERRQPDEPETPVKREDGSCPAGPEKGA